MNECGSKPEKVLSMLTNASEGSADWETVKELTNKLVKTYGQDNVENVINEMVNTHYTQVAVDIGEVLDALFIAVKKEDKR